MLTGLFLSAFLSATLLPGSSEALLISLLVLAEENPALLVAIATTGNVAGSVVNWICGSYLISFQDKRWFPVSAEQINKATRWYKKFGIWSLLLAWLPIIGDPITMVAGILRVPLVYFLILVTTGKCARYTILVTTTLYWT